jgi:predicted house-cleaning noncanonical NTP pyrophosphatase (MazG superfamily)
MNQVYQEQLKQIDNLIEVLAQSNDFKVAFGLYKKIKSFLDNNHDLKEKDNITYRKFKQALLKSKFLSLNYFDDWQEISELLKDNLDLAFEMPGYDFWSKLKVNLQYINDWEERDEIKKILVKSVRACNKSIIDDSKYQEQVLTKISDWIKSFISHLDFEEKVDPVKKAEYINNNREIKKLKIEDKQRAVALLNLYEALSVSSQQKYGFEDTVFMVVDGKRIILTRNGIDDVDAEMKKIRNIKAYQENTNDEDNDDVIRDINEFDGSNEEEDLELEDYTPDAGEKLLILKGMLSEYEPDSLEAKALQEEINRLNKINVKQR